MFDQRTVRVLLYAAVGASYTVGCASVAEPPIRAQYAAAHQARHAHQARIDTLPSFQEKPATLDDYLRYAFAHNPRLRAAFARWSAALERVPQARSLDDPVLSFEYFLEQMDTRYQLSVTQMLPVPGGLRLAEGRAASEARAAMNTFEAERFELYERVVRAFNEYHYLSRSTAISEDNHRLLIELEQAIDARYQSGAVPYADLIKVQVEREQLADRLASLRDQRRAQSASLGALLHLRLQGPLPWPIVEPSDAPTIDESVLTELLADLNPELKAADAMIEAAVQREELARRSGWPRFMIGAGYMVMPGRDGRKDASDLGLMTGFTLPIWRGRYRAENEEAAALLRATEHDRDEMRNRLRAELSLAVFQFRDAERRSELMTQSLIPKARQALAVARQAYADGQTEFMTMIDAQRTLFEFQLLAERALADREIALADINCCVGVLWSDPGSLPDLSGRVPEQRRDHQETPQ